MISVGSEPADPLALAGLVVEVENLAHSTRFSTSGLMQLPRDLFQPGSQGSLLQGWPPKRQQPGMPIR